MAGDDTVPWMVGGGIEHSVEVARLLAYAAFNGQEGVIGSKDLEVRQGSDLSTAATTGVRVFPGACSILNRSQVAAYDAYAARFPNMVNVPIASTGASARNDLIVARIENPYEVGEAWPLPTQAQIDAGTAVFRRIAVISGVSATAKTPADAGFNYSAIALARIAMPANTSAVLQSYITDLRRLSSVLSEPGPEATIPVTASSSLTASAYASFPVEANVDVDVPAWATHADLSGVLGGVLIGTSGGSGPYNANGYTRMTLGAQASAATAYNVSVGAGTDRVLIMNGGQVAIPDSMRGTTQTLRMQGIKTNGNTSLQPDSGSTARISVRWRQQPETNA